MITENNYFSEAFSLINNDEGGYSNVPNDRGGETYCGISRKYNPSWPGWKIIDEVKEMYNPRNPEFEISLKQAQIIVDVMDFYKKNYWDILHCEEIESKEISLKLFDMSVNLGISRAVIMLQTSLIAMSCAGDYDVSIDGKMGSITVKLLNEICKKESNLLLNLLTIQQGNLYLLLAKNDKSQREFLRGWINRLDMKVELFNDNKN